MFRNGSAQPHKDTGVKKPQSTKSLIGDVFGVGPLLKMIADPEFQGQAHAMVMAIIESARATQRIEAKLDLVLAALNATPINSTPINSTPINGVASDGQTAGPLALLDAHRADGAGGSALATGSDHHGGGQSQDRALAPECDNGAPKTGVG
jgi:hypothetical protein